MINLEKYEEMCRLANSYFAAGEYYKAIKINEELLEIEENNFEIWKNLSSAQLKIGKLNESIKSAKKSLEIISTYNEFIPDEIKNIIVPLAEVNIVASYSQKGEYKKAIDRATSALTNYPKNERLWNNLASVYSICGNYNSALKCIKNALKIKPDYDIALCLKGTIYLGLRKYKKAIKVFEKVLDQNPYNVNALYGISMAYFMTNERVKSLNHLSNLSNIIGKDEYRRIREQLNIKEAQIEESKTINAWLAYGAGYYNESEKLFSEIIYSYSKDPDILNAYGYSLYEIGRTEDAYDIFKKIVEIDKNNAEAYINISRYLLEHKENEEQKIINFTTKAIKLNPNLDMAWNNRSCAKFLIGDTESALSDIKHALQLNPDNEKAYYNFKRYSDSINNLNDYLTFEQLKIKYPDYKQKQIIGDKDYLLKISLFERAILDCGIMREFYSNIGKNFSYSYSMPGGAEGVMTATPSYIEAFDNIINEAIKAKEKKAYDKIFHLLIITYLSSDINDVEKIIKYVDKLISIKYTQQNLFKLQIILNSTEIYDALKLFINK